jgi:hypothetical protein
MNKIQFSKVEDVKSHESLEAWAEVNNVHIDEVRQEDYFGLMYFSYKYFSKNGVDTKQLYKIVIWDKMKNNAWSIGMYDYINDKECRCVLCDENSKEYNQLKDYAINQWSRLAHKYIGGPHDQI